MTLVVAERSCQFEAASLGERFRKAKRVSLGLAEFYSGPRSRKSRQIALFNGIAFLAVIAYSAPPQDWRADCMNVRIKVFQLITSVEERHLHTCVY